MPSRPTATTNRTAEGFITVGSNPLADIAEQTPQNIDLATATPEQVQAYNTGIAAAKFPSTQTLSTSQITAATRQQAGAPLTSPLSGAGGQIGATGINPQNFSYTPSTGTMGVTTQRTPVAGAGNVAAPEGMGSAEGSLRNANIGDPILIAKARAEDANARKAALEEQETRRRIERTKAMEKAAGNAAGTAAETAPTDSRLEAMIAKIPEDIRPILEPLIRERMADTEKNLAENEDLFGDITAKNEEMYAAMQSELDQLKTDYKKTDQDIKGVLDEIRTSTEKQLSEEKEIADKRLEWDLQKQIVTIERNKTKAHEALVSQLALAGGFGQTAGLAAVAASDKEFDDQMANLRTETGFARTDLAVKYSGLYVEAQNEYRNGMITEIRALQSDLERLTLQSQSNRVAKQNTENQIMIKRFENVIGMREKLSEFTMGIATEIIDHINDERRLRLEEAKANKTDPMSTKDKLGFVSKLRDGIQSNKTITQANDADGFYGALSTSYDVYKAQIADPTNKESLNAAQTAVIGSFARILDPNSVVRNEEYERQVYGQSWINTVNGLATQASRGGAGLTEKDIDAMKKVADQIHASWETRLQSNLQPFILDINDWNTSYPEAPVKYSQVIPINRIHLPEQTTSVWSSQTGWETPQDSGHGGAPLQGFIQKSGGEWRTDRNNNPIAFAVNSGGTNEFTDALEAAGIGWEYGDTFPGNPAMSTVRILGDPVEGARAVLENSHALQNWYLSPNRPYYKELARFGIKNNEDFKALPLATQNEIIIAIYKGEVGNGSLVASILNKDDSLAQYDDITFLKNYA